jgi:hypothetical protein
MMDTGLYVVNALVNDSGNILWSCGPDREDLKPRVDEALARAKAALPRIDVAYAELALPAAPLCGSQGKKKRK